MKLTLEKTQDQPLIDFNSKEWWSLNLVAKALGVGTDALKQLMQPYVVLNSKWFGTGAGPMKTGKTLAKELVLLLKKEVEKSRKIPEGWLSAQELSETMDCPVAVIYSILRSIFINHTDLKNDVKDLTPKGEKAKIRKYYSPKIRAIVLEQLEKFPLMPNNYKTVRQLCGHFRSDTTRRAIPKILETLMSRGIVKSKFFTSYNDGLVVECFPAGTEQKVQNFLIRLKEEREKRSRPISSF